MALVSMVAIDNPDARLSDAENDEADEIEAELPQGNEALGLGTSVAVEAALNGQLNPGYVPKYYENDKLKPKHMKILRMAVAGYTNREIAQRLGYTEGRISILINHQDSRAIMARMVGAAADKLGVSERLQGVAGEMLEHVIMTTRTTHDDRLRSKNAFELLNRAGYGNTTKVQIDDKRETSAPPAILSRLVEVLNESNALRATEYDPTHRALSAAAQNMIEGTVVEVIESSPSLEPIVSGDMTSRAIPPDGEPQLMQSNAA